MQGAGGNPQRIGLRRQCKAHAGVSPWQQTAGLVIDLQLHQRGTGRRTDRIGGRDDRGQEHFLRVFRHADLRAAAEFDLRRIGLRHLHIDPQATDLGHCEQLLSATAVASVDQRADIGGACGDHPVKRRDQALKTLGRGQSFNVGLGRHHLCLFRRQIAVALVDFLFRNRVRRQHCLPALGTGAGQGRIGFGGGQVGAGLQQLLVQFRGIDFSE
ncbi:hypothetical protein D3C87_1363190 [compost metagenome]